MMKIDAQLVCRKEPFGAVCGWTGGSVAEITGAVVDDLSLIPKGASPIGAIIKFGGLRMRVIEPYVNEYGAYCDSHLVTLANDPRGELQILYRSTVRWLLKHVCKFEARIHGFMLRPYEGKQMPFTSWLYSKLL